MSGKVEFLIFHTMTSIVRYAAVAGAIATLAAGVAAGAAENVALCHATGAEDNPFVLISVSVNALHGHEGHEGDFVPDEGAGCGPVIPPE